MSAAAEKVLETPISGVMSDQVLHVWDRVKPILRRVVRPEVTGETLDSVLTDIQMRHKQLWIIGDFQGVVLTAILDRPAHRVLFVPYLAGDNMSEWLDDWVVLQEEYAKAHNCYSVEFNGRKGWNKIGERFPEYKSMQTIFQKRL